MKTEGVGNAGRRCTRSLVCETKQTHELVTTGHRRNPAFPHAMVLRLTSRSPRRPGFVVTVGSRIKVLSAPGWADLPPQDLTPASGRQNHTTWPYASASFVQHAVDCSQALSARPAITHMPNAAASTASLPAFVTFAKRPSVGRDGLDMHLIWVSGEEKYFCKRGLTRFLKIRSDLPVGQNHASSRATNPTSRAKSVGG